MEPAPRRAALGALLLAALPLVACQGGNAAPPAALPEFDGARAWAHMEAQVALGPRPSGSEANAKLRDYMVKELQALGLKAVRQPFTAANAPGGPIEMENVYADFEGRPRGGEPAPMVVIGAHFDTKRMTFPFVGANDGASGVGALLELARVLTSGPPRAVTYRFLFLDGEEAVRPTWMDPDNCYGSRHHVAELKKTYGALKRVRAMILLDMIGDADLVLENDTNSTSELLTLFKRTAARIGEPDLFGKYPNPIHDDHEQFKAADIPAVDLIDLHYGPSANEYWHTPQDVLAHCSKESVARVGKLVLAALPEVEEKYGR